MVADVFEKKDGMSVGGVVKHGLEVRRAGGQNHLVGFQIEPIASDRHVDESLMVEEVFEDGEEVMLVVVPAQTVLLRLGGANRHHGSFTVAWEGGEGWIVAPGPSSAVNND